MKNRIKIYDDYFKRSTLSWFNSSYDVYGSDAVLFYSQRNVESDVVSSDEVVSLSYPSFPIAAWDWIPRLSSRSDDFRSLVRLSPYLHEMQK